MAFVTVRTLPPLIATSSGSTTTNTIGLLDDATSIMIYVTSSASCGTSTIVVQVAGFDIGDKFVSNSGGNSPSTSIFYTLTLGSTTNGAYVLTSGSAFPIANVSFRSLRLGVLSSAIAGEIIAHATKQVSV